MNLHQILKKLKEYDGARITETELREYVSIPDYEEYYSTVNELVNNSIIAPVKSSGSNGMRPPLHKRYTVIKPEQGYDELIPEIRLLHHRFNIEGYLADPEKYKIQRHWLRYLDNFLKYCAKSLEAPISINERSFQIFKREKALKEDRELSAVRSFNPGLWEALNFYNTPEPFFTYNISHREADVRQGLCQEKQELCQEKQGLCQEKQGLSLNKTELNILIIENKDTWYTLGRIMSPCCRCIAGIRFDSMIYGEGKKISRRIDSLTEFDRSFFKDASTAYYYFGDLDYEGIGIANDLISANPMLQIRLMTPLYIAMLKASENIQLPVMKEKQNKKAVEWFISLFEKGQQELIKSILHNGRYIPQEILNCSDFSEMLGGNE